MTTLSEEFSRLGLRQYYIDKQQGKIDTGTVPDRKSLMNLMILQVSMGQNSFRKIY